MNWQVQLISDGLDHWVHQCHNSEISVTAAEDLRLGSLSYFLCGGGFPAGD